MKRILLLTTIICAYGINATFAQTNLDLETWSGNDPDSWSTLNQLMVFGAPQSTFQETADPGEGASSAKLVSFTWTDPGLGLGDFLPGALFLGGIGTSGVPYTLKPDSMSFMYKANPMSGDTCMVFVQLSNQAVPFAVGALYIDTPVTIWTSVTIPINYFDCTLTPDSIIFGAVSSLGPFLSSTQAIPGSELFVDSFVLSFPTNVAPVANDDAATTDSAVAVVIDVQANDNDPNCGDLLTTTIIGGGPANGTASVMGGDSIQYTHTGLTGNDTIWYKVCDNGPLCDSAKVVITVISPPACPLPIASFTFDTTGLAVNFTNTSTVTGTTSWAWTGDDSFISNAQNPSHTYSSAGTYNVCLGIIDSCGNSTPFCDSVTVTGSVGISELFAFESIKVYPNPAVNELNIVTSFNKEAAFDIFDIVGRQIKSVAMIGDITRVSIAELPEGMYLYQIVDRKGTMLAKGKFNVVR